MVYYCLFLGMGMNTQYGIQIFGLKDGVGLFLFIYHCYWLPI